ncbi:MAG: NAD kinase [Saprospiraceae bacterium]|nr:NAD kinase [Saprospiraceae bacterium]MCB9344422.1 NAD kinase [Lewinellaceae bacterium]
MRLLVYGKQVKEKDLEVIQELFDCLVEEEIDIFIYEPYLRELESKVNIPSVAHAFEKFEDFRAQRIDFVVVLGGDGTMLAAVTLVRDSGVPMLGINLGRMGFLATIDKHQIKNAIQKLVANQFTIIDRSMIYLESNPPLFGELPFALNDCTLLKRDTSSMITVHAFLNGDYLNTYWADGIIIATPTGSTGYSLSCGGPVIFPNSGNFIITPVAPHNLNVRPIVISDESVISFEVEGRAENFICTLDSRFELIGTHHQIAVRKNDFCTKLIQLQDITFQNTIRVKLGWGDDIRN